jgi:hypothetical protein
MLKVFCFFILFVSFFSCQKKKGFEISGTITGAEGQTLFLEKNSLEGKDIIDSVVLSSKGDFVMLNPRPDKPEFYNLRLGKNQIFLAIDSTERITISASADSFRNYRITGSDANRQLKNLFVYVNKANTKIEEEVMLHNKHQLHQDSLYILLENIITDYKKEAKRIIISDPTSPAAYFALFQKLIYDITPFSLADKEDLKYYAAVATAWNFCNKGTLRARQLKDLVTYGQEPIKQGSIGNSTESSLVGYIDINLPDKDDNIRSLVSFTGNVILVDFCSYFQYEPYRIIELRDLYTKNREKGFEIYQISYDKDIEYWKTVAGTFPWTCVNDSKLSTAIIYNVNKLPTNYLIDRKGNIIGKNVTMEAVHKFMEKE